MNKITKGNVVKFVDSDGAMNGGTVVEFSRKDNEEYVLLNTLDGKNIRKNVDDVHPIKRQQRGRISAKFMDELKEEIRKENAKPPTEEMLAYQVASKTEEPRTKVPSVPVVNEESAEVNKLKRLLSEKDVIIKNKEAEILSCHSYIKDLESRLENCNVPNLLLTVKGLGDALLAASINKEGDMVQELLNIINKLIGVSK